MYWLLLLLLIVIPAIEIGVFIWTGSYIGVWSVISLIILTGVVGAWIVKQQGIETWRRAQMNIQRGELPREQILDGICVIIGAIFLITPGFVTDILGFLLVIPWTRRPFKWYLTYVIAKKLSKGSFIYRRW